ncbi:MAG: glycosyltransferase [Elusimicrobia bacterium]|nr:glycosyltransferase [Elusimicrobiota bacterium]
MNHTSIVQARADGRDQGARPSPDLAIVIPALNERENLELLLPALREVIQTIGIATEIVVVDGGSRDGTREAAERRGARVVPQHERGYGGALLAGFAATRAPFIVTMDADLSHRPLFVAEFWNRRGEAEVLIASRYVPGGRADMGWVRRLLSQILNRTYRRALSLPIRDLSSGFRMYRRETLAGLDFQARDFDILEEILIRVYAEGWRIVEVPFHYMSRGSGRSHARLLKFGWAFAKTLARMWRLRNSVASADYDYRAFDSPIWLQRYWQRARHRIVLGYLESRDAVVDVGCGSSRIIIDLPGALAVDILQNKLRWLRPLHRPLVRASGDLLPLREGSVDTLITSEVIEHVPNACDHLAEATRILRPGGILVVGTPDYGQWLWWVLEWLYGKILPDAYAHEHITHYTRTKLHAELGALGYEILDCRYVGFCEMIVKARKPTVAPRT